MWRIINNRTEKIMNEKFETKEMAEKIMNHLIGIMKVYDFDVEYFEDDNVTYEDYMDMLRKEGVEC